MTDILPPVTNLDGGVGVGVTQLDLSSIGSALSSDMLDPALQIIEPKAGRPAVAAPTAGPHRWTMHVPHNDGATLNVGTAVPDSRFINDTGIVGTTTSHIHFHTRADANKTMVALGGGTKHGWPSHGSNVLEANVGYTMVTENRAWMDAKDHVQILSRTKDTALRAFAAGKRVVVQADQGDVNVIAKHKSIVCAPEAALVAPAEVNPQNALYGADWNPSPEATRAKAWKTAVDSASLVQAAYDLGMKVKKTVKKYKDGKLKLDEENVTDAAKWLLDGYKATTSLMKLIDPPHNPGTASVSADADVKIAGGGSVSIYGKSSFSASSAIFSSMGAVVSASMKSAAFCGVTGTWMSVKGYRKVEVGSDWGKVVVKGKADVELTSEEANAKLSGKVLAQAVSDGKVYLAGKGRTVLSGGDGSQSGVVATQDALTVGMLTKGDEVDGASLDGNDGILMTRNSHMKLGWGNSTIKMEPGQVELTCDKLVLWAKSGDASLNAKQIRIG